MTGVEGKRFWVYLVSCEATSKQYVGVTGFSIARRWGRHVNRSASAKPRNGNCPALHAAIRKHGEAAFTVAPIYAAFTWAEALRAEVDLIQAFGTKAPTGYNVTDGGEGVRGRVVSDAERTRLQTQNLGRVVSPETRLRQSVALTGRTLSPSHRAKLKGRVFSVAHCAAIRKAKAGFPFPCRRFDWSGRHHSAATRAKMSVWQVGKVLSDQTKGRIRSAAIGRKASASSIEANRIAQTGRVHSAETLERMRAAKVAKAVPVRCVNTGRAFASIKEAARDLALPVASLRRHVAGLSGPVRGMAFERIPA